MRLSAKLLCAVCLLLMQVMPVHAAKVRIYASTTWKRVENWEKPNERTIIASPVGWKQRATIGVQGSKNMPAVRVISGGTSDIKYSIDEGKEKRGDWFIHFDSSIIWHKPHTLAVELDVEGGRFPVKIRFEPNIKVKIEGHRGGGDAWRGNLTLHLGFSANHNPGGRTGLGFFMTFGGALHTWQGKIPISIVLEGNVVYNDYKLEYNTEGITDWAHVNSTEFQPRLGVRINIPGNKDGRFGAYLTPFVGGVFRVVKHDNDVTGLSDDLRLHLIHGRLELNGGIALGFRMAFFFNRWLGISAEVAWAGTWNTLKEIGDPIKWGFASNVYGNIGVTGRF